MREFNTDEVVVMHGSAGQHLAEKVAKQLSIQCINPVLKSHNDGEARIQIPVSVRGKHVYVVNQTGQPDRNLIEMLQIGKTARMSSAQFVSAVLPYAGWQRQDRPDGREPNAAALHIKMLKEIGEFEHLMCFDTHSEMNISAACTVLDGFPYDHLYTSQFALPWLMENVEFDVLLSPDVGGMKRLIKWQKLLAEKGYDVELAFAIKHRGKPGEVDWAELFGASLSGKKALLVDDMIDTFGTQQAVSRAAFTAGVRELCTYASHGLYSEPAMERIRHSGISRVISTNSIYHEREFLDQAGVNLIHELDMSPLIAEAIRQIESDGQISNLIIDNNQ